MAVRRHAGIRALVSLFVIGGATPYGATAAGDDRPCEPRPYRQIGASLPLTGLSLGDEGHPWRAMYGYCLRREGRFTLQQDWVVSWLDAEPQGEVPGGRGVSVGTDLSIRWSPDRRRGPRPFLELGTGVQYAAGTPFPAHGSRLTFAINLGTGLLIPLREDIELVTALRYLHLSNAGILPDNAGYDAFHALVAVRWII